MTKAFSTFSIRNLVGADFSLRNIMRTLIPLRAQAGAATRAATVAVVAAIILGTVPNRAFATSWTETSDTDFNDGVKSSVTVQGSGDAAYVRISTIQATGGTITYSGGYVIHTFTSGETFTPNGAMTVQVLVVGGGGGTGGGVSGIFYPAGGGGGQVSYNASFAVTSQAYTVTVGGGGIGQADAVGGDGQDSIFSTITGSKGKGGGTVSSGVGGASGSGYAGGATNGTASSGGGGNSAVGGNAPTSTAGGNGGNGTANSISGSSIYYGGGGGGQGSSTYGTVGLGGGGNNYGGGGNRETPVNGGSGIVIVRYPSYFSTGTYKSNVTDALYDNEQITNVSWSPSSLPAGTTINVYVRGQNVSFSAGDAAPSWTAVTNGQDPAIAGRYIQWMSTFTTTNSTTTPTLENITVTYGYLDAPTGFSGTADSDTQITWNWTDNSSSPQEVGFKIKNTGGSDMGSVGAGAVSWPESGLTANTQYTRYVQAYTSNVTENSGNASRYTLPVAPTNGNVTCDKATDTVHTTALFTFSSSFGAGTFKYLMYKWDTSAGETTWPDTWSSGALSKNALIQNTSYYLHIKAYNGDDAANATTLTKGPYCYQSDYSAATDTTDSDFDAGLVKSSVTVVGTGDAGYVEISTAGAVATGGTITYDGEYVIHTFTSGGTFTPNVAMNVEYLVVAGGGSGGGNLGGGGGAGGFRTATGFAVTAQAYPITVGAGGAGVVGTQEGVVGINGGDSIFSSITSIGGGAGGAGDTFVSPNIGGSGGGASGYGTTSGAAGTADQGNAGGNGGGGVTNYPGGGGGGSNALGQTPASSSVKGGAGGAGTLSSITGTSLYWAGGGGGGGYDAGTGAGNGGIGGGGGAGTESGAAGIGGGSALNSGITGNSGVADSDGGDGGANTGSGGGSTGHATVASPDTSGSGGSGIVIVRYRCYRPAGELQSRVHDTTEVGTSWGEISWGENTPAGTDVKLKSRTGDTGTPDGSWSSWYPAGDVWYEVNTGTPIGSPRARYIQYLSSFTTTISTHTPQLTEVNIQFSTNSATPPNLTSPDSTWNNSTPVFDWVFGDNENDTQTAYQIQLSTDINFSMVNYSTGPYSSVYSSMTWPSANPMDDGIYWWQCKTQDGYGKWSVWSDTYQVKVDTIAPVNMTVSWIRSDNENQITLEGTGTDSGGGLNADAWWFEETSGNTGGTSSSVWESTSVYTDSGLSKNTQYTYRVRLRDVFGNISGYSTAVTKWTLPAVWKENGTVRTGGKAFGTSSNSDWTWEIPVKGGQAATVTAYIRYNDSYGSAALPKIILSNNGVNDSAQMTGGADVWEKVTVTGTPSADGVILLRFLAYSTQPGAEVYVDDIQVMQ